jgi:hypothetical protein
MTRQTPGRNRGPSLPRVEGGLRRLRLVGLAYDRNELSDGLEHLPHNIRHGSFLRGGGHDAAVSLFAISTVSRDL